MAEQATEKKQAPQKAPPKTKPPKKAGAKLDLSTVAGIGLALVGIIQLVVVVLDRPVGLELQSAHGVGELEDFGGRAWGLGGGREPAERLAPVGIEKGTAASDGFELGPDHGDPVGQGRRGRELRVEGRHRRYGLLVPGPLCWTRRMGNAEERSESIDPVAQDRDWSRQVIVRGTRR